jgi:hypothetical protein
MRSFAATGGMWSRLCVCKSPILRVSSWALQPATGKYPASVRSAGCVAPRARPFRRSRPRAMASGPTVACAPPQDYAAANAAQVAAAGLEMYLKRSWNVIPPGGRAGSSATSRSK